MPRRKVVLSNNETYHIYNRTVWNQPLFENKRDYSRFVELLDFYRFKETAVKFSRYSTLNMKLKNDFLSSLYESEEQISLYSFALMPNHYHLLVKQNTDDGITYFIHKIQASYAKYFNLKNDRYGVLFQSRFKTVRVENEEQLLHTSRYIHLNPLTSFVLKEKSQLKGYLWNSYIDFLADNPRKFVDTDLVSSLFQNNKEFQNFTFDRLDYQRNIKIIKNLILE